MDCLLSCVFARAIVTLLFRLTGSQTDVIVVSRAADFCELLDLAVRRMQFVIRRMTWSVPRSSIQMQTSTYRAASWTSAAKYGWKATDRSCRGDFGCPESRTSVDIALSRSLRVLRRRWRSNREPRTQSLRATQVRHLNT